MLTLPPGVSVFVATARVDGRKGIDGLSVLVRSHFAEDPLSGSMFVFFSRRADRVRVLYWDRDGYVLVTKRLEKGTYRVPWPAEQGRGSSKPPSCCWCSRASTCAAPGGARDGRRASRVRALTPCEDPSSSADARIRLSMRRRVAAKTMSSCPRRATSRRRSPSALDPDLEAVKKFIADMIAKGAVAALVAAIVALLVKMRDLNTELMKRLASKSRKRPPNETMRRLQMELPLLCSRAANDAKPGGCPTTRSRRSAAPRSPRRTAAPSCPRTCRACPTCGSSPRTKRTCPHCDVEVARICIKTTAEKLDVRPSEFIVSQTQVETCSCPQCHQYIVTADKGDEVLDRGILGDELLVQALVDHYEDAVPWERMERNARAARRPARGQHAGRRPSASVIDLFDPIVRHIRERVPVVELHRARRHAHARARSAPPAGHQAAARSGSSRATTATRASCTRRARMPSTCKKFFEGRTLGSVMCDGSPTNNCVEEDAGGRRGGCNAHGRRGLVEALRRGDARAVEGLELYAKIFHVDAESKRLGESTRAALRAAPARQRAARGRAPRLGRPCAAATSSPRRLSARLSDTSIASGRGSRRSLRDPRMELTNNEVESGLRTWVLDRKTWLFVGHETSARRAADALTLITTCKKMGINPRAYLRDTLSRRSSRAKRASRRSCPRPTPPRAPSARPPRRVARTTAGARADAPTRGRAWLRADAAARRNAAGEVAQDRGAPRGHQRSTASARPHDGPRSAFAPASPSCADASRTSSCSTACPTHGSESSSSRSAAATGSSPFGSRAAVRHRQLRAPKAFHERTLWPEFIALCEELHAHLDELTTRSSARPSTMTSARRPNNGAPRRCPRRPPTDQMTTRVGGGHRGTRPPPIMYWGPRQRAPRTSLADGLRASPPTPTMHSKCTSPPVCT